MGTHPERPLLARWPALERRVPWCDLGAFPSPLDPLAVLAADDGDERGVFDGVFVKRDDIASPVYGGNKVRTLEPLFGAAREGGATEIWSTGAYGSNHAVATVLHAARVGLLPGVLSFPQPYSEAAAENLRITAVLARPFVGLPHWSWLPYGMWRAARDARRDGVRRVVMPPGGATPVGALGYVSAALELGEQLRSLGVDELERIVLGVGSTCTSAGLLVGVHVGLRLGLFGGDVKKVPLVHAVRVTPWPVTSAWRIVNLARRTVALLRELGVPEAYLPSSAELGAELRAGLALDGSQLGAGYGHPTRAGAAARDVLGAWGRAALDTTYGQESAAGLVAHARANMARPVVYWATKSSTVLPAIADADLATVPDRVRRFLAAT